jgi:Sel1 repeat
MIQINQFTTSLASVAMLITASLPQFVFAQDEIRWIPVVSDDYQQVSEVNARVRVAALTERANTGDMFAQISLGRIYELGRGVKANGAKALDWYKRAHQSGSPLASLSIAALYSFGNLVPRDSTEAGRWIEQYQQRGGIVPCATMASDLGADSATRSTLCAITHHWRIYAFMPKFSPSESVPEKPILIRLGFNPKQKTLVVIESNAPQRLIKDAQGSLIATISSIAMPTELAQHDGEITFDLSYAIRRDPGKVLVVQPLHWRGR